MSHLLDARRREVLGLAVLLGFTLLAVGGYSVFALHPERIPQDAFSLAFFRISFQFFAQLHILLAFVALAVVLVGRLGGRWLPALLAVYVLSFTAEHVGTGYGIPFGGYGYTGLLGYKLGGRVPVLIPLSWFLMALPAWVMTRAALPQAGSWLARVLVAPVWLVAWDLALDPAMSYLTAYWRWEESGPYYGMPWLNLLGWYVTGLALMAALEALADRTGFHQLPVRWMIAYYVVVALLPIGMLVGSGSWTGVLVTVAGMGACVLLVRALGGGERSGVESSPTPASLAS